MADRVSCILLLQHLSTHVHFITNGYKRFSKTNSTDSRQRVPLNKRVTFKTQYYDLHMYKPAGDCWDVAVLRLVVTGVIIAYILPL